MGMRSGDSKEADNNKTTNMESQAGVPNATATLFSSDDPGEYNTTETEPPAPPSIPESTAYWSKEPYAWSTSLDYTPPLLTSSHCASALYRLFHNTYYYEDGDIAQPNFLLAVVTESSSHPTGLSAVLAQPWMYAGPGLGSVDECPLQTCLAGGRSTDTITFAAVCTVPECSAYDLAADDFVSTVARQLQAVQKDTAAAGVKVPLETIQIGQEYVLLLERIAEVNKFLQTGWTCGTFVVPFPAWPWGIPFVALCGWLVLASLIGTNHWHYRYRSKKRTTETSTRTDPATNKANYWGSQHSTIAATDSEESGSMLGPQEKDHHQYFTTNNGKSINGTLVASSSVTVTNGRASINASSSSSSSESPSPSPFPPPPQQRQIITPSLFWSAFDASQHLKQLVGSNRDSDSNSKNNANVSQKTAGTHRETACLDGLRVGSIFWIMLGHCMAIQSSSGAGYANPANFLPPSGLTNTLPGQLLFSSRLAVDTFLCISGFLVVYVINAKMPVRQQTQQYQQNRSTTTGFTLSTLWTAVFRRYLANIPSLILTRVVRILPLYAMCLGFYTQIAPQLGGGPFWHQWIDLLKPCHDSIWANLFFVNNFLPLNTPTIDTCFYHSWYLAVDMQLFVLAPLLVFWFQYHCRQGLTATATLWASSVLTTLYLSYVRRWSVNTFDGAAVDRYDTEAYAKPHVRGQSYLAGMAVAMVLLMEERQQQQHQCEQRYRYIWKHRCAMAATIMILVLTTFLPALGAYARRPCTYGEEPLQGDDCGSLWSAEATWLYTGLSRTVWATGIAVLIYLCVERGNCSPSTVSARTNKNMVASILSWRCWTPLAQLSFGAYLIHPIVIFVWQLGDREKQTFRLLTFGMDYLSVCVVSYVGALLAAVTVEFPCATLWKNFVVRQKNTNNQRARSHGAASGWEAQTQTNGQLLLFARHKEDSGLGRMDEASASGEYGSMLSLVENMQNGTGEEQL